MCHVTIIITEKIIRSLQHNIFLSSLISSLQNITITKVKQMSTISWAFKVICIKPTFAIAFKSQAT